MLTQPFLHENQIVQRRDDREKESSAQEHGASNPYPTQANDFEQKHKENSTDLRKSIRLPKDARAEVPEPGNGKQNSAGRQDRDVAAEHKHSVFPGDLVQDREHEKHSA